MTNSDLKSVRGQFNTTNRRVQKALLSLILNSSGKVLEPSAGSGDLVLALENSNNTRIVDAVELDTSIARRCSSPITYSDFFAYTKNRNAQYATILGNPPFVAWKKVEGNTRGSASEVKKRYSDKTNLYHLFMDRCIDLLEDAGELVFIVPKEWLYTTSAAPLREKMLREGYLTHIIDCGEEKLFDDASVPALVIFRYQKASVEASSRKVKFAGSLEEALAGSYEERELLNSGNRFMLVVKASASLVQEWGTLGEQYEAKVGIVSGADSIFRYSGSPAVEASSVKEYLTTKGIEKFIDVNHVTSWADMPPKTAAYLLTHKSELIGRRIARFDESNWWMYGAVRNKDAMLENKKRFFVFGKTRSSSPFFTGTAKLFSGGIIGIFQKANARIKLDTAIKLLNHSEYRKIIEGLFITTSNKVSFQPSTLHDLPFPRTEEQAQEWLTNADSSNP